MSNLDIEQQDGWFIVTWKIENVSLCMYEDICLRSPVFATESDGGNVWWKLKVETVKGSLTPSIVFILEKLCGKSGKEKCQMSVYGVFGEVNLVRGENLFTAQKAELFSKKEHSITCEVPKDNIVISCKVSHDNIVHGKLLFSTVLQKETIEWDLRQLVFYYEIHKLHNLKNVQLISSLIKNASENPDLLMFELLPTKDGCPYFASFKKLPSNYDERICFDNKNFSCNIQVWKIDRNFCKYAIAKIQFIIAFEQHSLFHPVSAAKDDTTTLCPSSLLKSDLMTLYKEKPLSDATLNTGGQSFPAHKSILAARSAVFRAMFESDHTTEGRSGVVDIDDLDSVTVDRMLAFLYSDSLADLTWKDASSLYYAADKYAVHGLKQMCADMLKKALSKSNVFDTLTLANKHDDDQLMAYVTEFIRLDDEIVSSKEYEEFADGFPRLAAKLMRDMYLKK